MEKSLGLGISRVSNARGGSSGYWCRLGEVRKMPADRKQWTPETALSRAEIREVDASGVAREAARASAPVGCLRTNTSKRTG